MKPKGLWRDTRSGIDYLCRRIPRPCKAFRLQRVL